MRFFDFTNPSEAVGFFANRNHFASLLYCVTLFAGVWTVEAALGEGDRQRRTIDATHMVALIASFTILVMFVAAQAMARSRAGLVLAIVALIGVFALPWADPRRPKSITPMRVMAASIALGLMFASQFALYRILERFTSDPLQDARIAFAGTTIEAAKSFMPVGSGMGTFVPVYALFEKPENLLINTYANRAHNDVLELWLESGLLGLGLMVVFAVWFLSRSIAVWGPSYDDTPPCNRNLARAATLVVGLLVAHSFVDYPLRTGAMMAIMAFACALLVEPLADGKKDRLSVKMRQKAHQKVQPSMLRRAARPPYGRRRSSSTMGSGQKWGQDIEWPQDWRSPSTPRDPRDK